MNRRLVWQRLSLFSLAAALVGLLALFGSGGARAQEPERIIAPAPEAIVGTGFTYQGYLTDAGAPVDGACTLTFSLWDAALGGNQIGGADIHPGVTVDQGRFTVLVNDGAAPFGNYPFDGNARWLAVTVDCGGGPFPLGPRQRLSPAPYAFSLRPGAVISGSLGTAILNVENTNTSPEFAGPGLAVSAIGIGAIVDAVGHGLLVDSEIGNGLQVSSAGQSGLLVQDAGNHGLWVLESANSGVQIEEANGDGLFVCSTGLTTGCTPSSSNNGLEVGNAQAAGVRVNTAVDGFAVVQATDDGFFAGTVGGNGLTIGSSLEHGIAIGSAGDEGLILTDAGGNGLRVQDAGGNGLQVDDATGHGVRVDNAGAAGISIGTAGTHGIFVLAANGGNGVNVASASADGVFVDSPNDDGVHVLNPGAYGVHVSNAGSDALRVDNAGGHGLRIQTATGSGIQIDNANDNGLQINAAGTAGVYVVDSGSDGLRTNSAGGDGLEVNSPGQDGVRIVNPGDDGVQVTGANDHGGYFSSNNVGVYARGGSGTAADLILGGNGSGNSDDDGRIVSDPSFPGSDIWLDSNDAVVVRLDVDNSGEDSDFQVQNAAGDVIFNVDDGGTTSVDVLQINGADLAERFDVRGVAGARPAPGMVVSIDPERPGRLMLSHEAGDRKVVGVISGAGGVQAGLVLGQEGTLADGALPVAITGRVYVRVDADAGAIQPGDFLTTSATPGVAVRAGDLATAQGAILGKAMTGLAEGQGLVLVLINLQ